VLFIQTNSKNKNIRDLYRGINEFKMSYQLRTNIIKEKNGDLLADSHSILNRWKNYFWQLLNVHGVSDVRQTEILSNIILSRLTPYVDEIIGDHQCEFRRNRPTTDQIFCIRQILEKKWEYNGTVHQLFIDFKKAYDSVRREVLYIILIESGTPSKLVLQRMNNSRLPKQALLYKPRGRRDVDRPRKRWTADVGTGDSPMP
jgi:hypothetical protein